MQTSLGTVIGPCDRLRNHPLQYLGRPRVDVLCRISGFFRDGFPDLVSLLAAIPKRLAELDEPDDMNQLLLVFGLIRRYFVMQVWQQVKPSIAPNCASSQAHRGATELDSYH